MSLLTLFFSGFPCKIREFIAKFKAGLRNHVKAKHTECPENGLDANIHLEPEIVVVEVEQIENQEQTQCE